MHSFNWNPREFGMMYRTLAATEPWNTGRWQSMDVAASPAHRTHELMDVTINVPTSLMPPTREGRVRMFGPDLPWADEHFVERVSGTPYNPAPSHVRWPYAVRGNADHTDADQRFDHTYPERFWPKHAGMAIPPGWTGPLPDDYTNQGIRFAYGDLDDVVGLLIRDRHTRQAFLPIWFPEDTGASVGQRVPCTLGYHFMIRRDELSVRYYLRSCDIWRHLRNDLYFTASLLAYVADQVDARAGRMITYVSSLHMFVGDVEKVAALTVDHHLSHGMAAHPATCQQCRSELPAAVLTGVSDVL